MMSLHPTTCPGRMAVAIGLALALLIAPSANATHKTDHRFTVWGRSSMKTIPPPRSSSFSCWSKTERQWARSRLTLVAAIG